MDGTQPASPINLFQNGQITLGQSSARVEKVINPETAQLDVAHVDQLVGGRPTVIPRRMNGSDVEVVGQQGLAAQHTLADRAAHYAQHGGQVELAAFLGSSRFTVAQALGTTLVLKDSKGNQKVVDLTKGQKLKWADVTPAFEERRTPSWRLNLRNVEGPDALQVQGDVAASMAVRYSVVMGAPGADFDQHAIAAQLTPMVEVTNRSDVDMKDMGLAIKLNEPRSRGPVARSAGMGVPESASMQSDVGGVSEGRASGVLTMPIRAAGTFSLQKGQTEWVNFAAAVQATPNDAALSHVPVKLDQSLATQVLAQPYKKVGETIERKSSPLTTYTLPGTAAARPAGTYEIFDEGDLALSQPTYQYTKKGDTLDLAGGNFEAISAVSKVTTKAFTEGTWTPVIDSTSRRPQYETAVHTYRTEVSVDLSSTSQAARDSDVSVNLQGFSEGVRDVRVLLRGRDLEANVVNGVIKVRVPVAAMKGETPGTSNLQVSFTGLNKETRSIPQ